MSMREMMTWDVPLLTEDDALAEGVAQLRRTKLDALPVVDKHGLLLGIFTKANLMDAFLAGAQLAEPLSLYVEREVVTVQVDMPYLEVVRHVKLSPVGTGVVVDTEGRVLGIFSKVNMIMALFKTAEQAAAKLNSIYEALPHGLLVLDPEARILQLNPAGERILGLKEEELSGSLFGEAFPHIDLDFTLKSPQHLVGVQVEMAGVKVLCNLSPVGRGTGAIVAFQALTELDQVASELEATKRLYETLLTVTNIAYEAIFVVDEQGQITLVNEATCRFFGKEEKDLMHRPVDEVIENTRMLRTLKTGMAETNEIQMIHGRPYIVSRIPIVRQGKVIGAVGKIVYQKLEEVKEVAERLAQMDGAIKYFKEQESSARQAVTFNQIVTVNPEMRRLKEEAEIAARGNSTIMLTGESGTGKELFAEAIHQASLRRKGPFIRVNCAAVPDNLLESEFFGYVNGAFTGAQRRGKPGKFAMAAGGTLFLDEIGDMSLNLQSKLLRVLEDKTFEPLGSNETLKADVRIIAATNQDLLQRVEKEEFRRDLYYRLDVIHFRIMPLRYRPEDVIPLAHVFLERLNRDFSKEIKAISPSVERLLQEHHWSGNVRELKNVLERSVNFASGVRLEVEDLPFYLRESSQTANLKGGLSWTEGWNLQSSSHKEERVEKEALERALGLVNGNKSEAARLLGISRSWLYEKMRRYKVR